jgi:hypothetical protein
MCFRSPFDDLMRVCVCVSVCVCVCAIFASVCNVSAQIHARCKPAHIYVHIAYTHTHIYIYIYTHTHTNTYNMYLDSILAHNLRYTQHAHMLYNHATINLVNNPTHTQTRYMQWSHVCGHVHGFFRRRLHPAEYKLRRRARFVECRR